MAKKPKAARPDAGGNRDHQFAFLAYQLGFASLRFPAMAAHLWKTAALDEPIPHWLRIEVERLADTTGRLAPLLPGAKSAVVTGVADAARRAWEGLEAAWGDETHRAAIERRDAADPGFRRLDVMLRDSPLIGEVWEELRRAVNEYTAALPGGVASWARLGATVAAIMDPRESGIHGLPLVATLQNQLSEMMPQPLLAGLPLNLSAASLETVANLHDLLWNRFLQVGDQEGQNAGTPPEAGRLTERSPEPPATSFNPLSKPMLAVALLSENENMSDTEVARRVGCSRTSLYRMKPYRRLKEILKARKGERRRGLRVRGRDGTSDTDGIDEREPWQDASD